MEQLHEDTLRNLASRLKLSRPLAFLDLETTGLSPETDRIVEIAVVTVHPDSRVTHLKRLLNPEMPIPEAASAVHGIIDADVQNEPTFRQLALGIADSLAGCDIAGFNIARFDLKLLAAEFMRAQVDFSLTNARVVDAMSIFHRNERRDLGAAVRFYRNREHQGHRASEDVFATIEVLAAQLDRYPTLPNDIDRLAEYCQDKQPDWLTADGKIAWRDGAARITFGKHAGKSLQTMKKEEPNYLNWMLERDFPTDVKRVVSSALSGEFPQGV